LGWKREGVSKLIPRVLAGLVKVSFALTKVQNTEEWFREGWQVSSGLDIPAFIHSFIS
jgi:hypothetical protein